MSKFTTTLKGLMALALGSFSLSAGAVTENHTTVQEIASATAVTAVPTQTDNKAIYILQSEQRGGIYADVALNQLTHCGTVPTNVANEGAGNGLNTHNDIAISGTDVNQQFSIITYGGKKYLYSVGAKSFVISGAADGSRYKAALSNTDVSVSNAELVMTELTYNSKKYFRFSIAGKGLNMTGYWNANFFKGVLLEAGGTPDPGNRLFLYKLDNGTTLSDEDYNAAIDVLKGELEVAKEQQTARLNDIKEFYHNKDEIDGYITLVQNASTEGQVNEIVENVFNALNGKLVYLMYAPREQESDYKYLGVRGVGNDRIAQLLPQRGTRAKWQLQRVNGTYRFRLRNIASDTYMLSDNNGVTGTPSNNNGYFEVEFKNNESTTNGVALKYHNSNVCLTVGTKTISSSSYEYVLVHTNDAAANVSDANNAWKVEPVGVDWMAIEEGYYVIRSNRGLTGTPNNYRDGFGGALLGVYTADRAIARDNQNLSTGVHLRQYSTGMHTIWKIVPQNDADGGFLIYSLIGEQDESKGGNLGMHFDGASHVTLTNEPTRVYIHPISHWTDVTTTSPIPNGVALCSERYSTDANNCFEVSKSISGNNVNDAFFVNANAAKPANGTTDLGTVFYIERVSDYDVEEARKAYVDYAAGTRSFELLKNVLTDDDIKYALSGKTTDPKSVETVAQANAYLNETGEDGKVSSTLAFERLDGKVVRFNNRMYADYYMSTNPDATSVNCSNVNPNAELSNLWRIEVVNAGLRQVKLINYKSNKYIGTLPTGNDVAYTLVDNANNAGTYTISRYYSIDGESFYANLLTSGNSVELNALHCGKNKVVVRWTHGELPSHWTIMNAVADDVKNTQIDLTINAKGDLISIKPAEGGSLTKTANFPAAYTVKLTPKAAATPTDAEATTPTEVVVPEANIKAATDGSGFEVNLAGLNVPQAEYTLNFPVGYFTANGKLAPALSKDVKVEDTTGIREVNAAEKGAEVIYDLQGRRVSKAGKGVYIINGVKTLVK